jgi:predicted CXXCH cytochrome family protein
MSRTWIIESKRSVRGGRAMKIKNILSVMLVAVLALAVTGAAQTDAGCVTDDCHSQMGKGKFVHGPVGAKICNVCHVEIEGSDHKFNFYSEKEELCLACHEGKRDMMLEDFVHSPVADGKCTGCHDPHQSDFRFTLKGNAADLCFQCHETDKFNQEHVHGPIQGGNCNACHDPHASENENQLMAPLEDICFNCHEDKSDIREKRHAHQPVSENCLNCHNPHSSVNENMLPLAKPQLCYGCHDDFSHQVVAHQPVAAGGCGDCHDVHGSDYPRMFKVPAEKLCFSCHNEHEIYITSKEFKHGPIMQGDCNACHNPHGSEFYRLLKKYFPEEFYMPYDTDNYAICFECHNKTIALDKETTTLTDFRDGKINLHYLHVNQEKGRSCKACHHPHATDQYKHIRKSVPFGTMDWELPVKYTKYDNGGRCEVGCHAPKEYHR